MKRTILIIAFFSVTLFCGKVSAQNSVIAQRPDQIYRIVSTIICNHTDTSTIACFNTEDNKAVFVLAGNSLNTIAAEISGYYINDMSVSTQCDSVYFCGYKVCRDTVGIIGHFDISDVFFATGSIYCQDNFPVGDEYNHAVEFERLITYHKRDNSHHVVCIGRTDNRYPCIVDLDAAPHGGYTGGYVSNEKETFTDIKRMSTNTQQYLVTSGIEASRGEYISLRKYDMENVISVPGIHDYIHTFCSNPSDLREWYNKEVLFTNVNENTFSTVSYRRSSYGHDPNGYLNVHLAFYDVGAFVVNSLSSMTKSVEIPIRDPYPGYSKLHRYITVEQDKLVFLHQTSMITLAPYTFCEVSYPMGLSGTLQFYGDRSRPLQGLTKYTGIGRYLMTGYMNPDNFKLMYEMETFGATSDCVEYVEYKYEDKIPMKSIYEYNPFIFSDFISGMKPVPTEKMRAPMYIDCPSND